MTTPRPEADSSIDVRMTAADFEALGLAAVILDDQRRIVLMSPAARDILGHPNSARDLFALTPSKQNALLVELTQAIDQRQTRTLTPIAPADHRLQRHLALRVAPLNTTNLFMLTVEDLTAQKNAESALANSERLASVGELAARVAHELNNPLDGILRYVNLAMRCMGEEMPTNVREYLQESRSGLLRMTRIIRDLLQFSRNASQTKEDQPLNDLLDEAVRQHEQQAAKQGVAIICSLQDHMVGARIAEHLHQVFSNLIKNALDAMPTGGALTISTECTTEHILVQFEDTGHGIEGDPESIFEPFFTTKAPGQGTGLGLAICRDIIQRCGGTIAANNRPSGGAQFALQLPVDLQAVATEPQKPSGKDSAK